MPNYMPKDNDFANAILDIEELLLLDLTNFDSSKQYISRDKKGNPIIVNREE